MAVTLRDRLVEMAVLGISASGTGAALAWFLKNGFKEDDVFAFFGALVGAAATVAGAIWVNDRADRTTHRREQSELLLEFQTLLDLTNKSIALFSRDHPWPPEFKPSLHELSKGVRETPALLREALAQAKSLDFRERVKLLKVEEGIRRFDGFYEDVFSPDELDPMDERDWPWALEGMKEALSEAVQALQR